MLQKIFIFILIAVFVGIAIYEGLPNRIADWLQSDQKIASLLDRARSKHSLPDPLFGPIEAIDTTLTADGVLEYTNQHRREQNLLPLIKDPALQIAAEEKLKDMFNDQYFEHNSPDGKKPADFITNAGYQFLVVGENLALGNYKDDKTLVQAWMDSPGHRANILGNKFQEIGVAVGKGQFQGKEIWLAVQEFGTPIDVCPSPNKGLQRTIESNQTEIRKQEADLATRRKNLQPENYQSQSQYEKATADYNKDVQKLNTLISKTKQLVEDYNQDVNAFNGCLETNA